jgi:GNAT superfamily N-acetyltransferase
VITYQREQVSDVLSEIKPLLEMHWREIAHYQDIPLEPDWTAYKEHPGVRVFTARLNNELTGYVVFILSRSKHYQSSFQAHQDILYLHPEHRAGRTGYKLIKYCDEQLRAEGVQVVYHHAKVAKDFGRLLMAIGYEAVDTIYGRRLDKENSHGS